MQERNIIGTLTASVLSPFVEGQQQMQENNKIYDGLDTDNTDDFQRRHRCGHRGGVRGDSPQENMIWI